MLTELKVKNYALIKAQSIAFRQQFNVITGETGTGKSIILGALGLILGKRADTSVLNDPQEKCVVEGSFSIDGYQMQSLFETYDLDYDPQTLIRREIAPSGKSRAFVNDTPVKLDVLKELGKFLVDIHSQDQTSQINEPRFQLSLLDAFANHTNLIKDFHQIYRQYQQLQAKLQELENLQQQTKRDQDYYQFQLNEIEEAQIEEAEEDQLERELDVLSNAEKIKGNLQEAITLLFNSEQDVQGQVAEIRYQIGEISNFNESLEKLYERLNSLEIEVKDIADEASDIEESVIVDNNRLEEVNNRLQLINQLLNKHGYQSTKDLLAYANELKANLQQTENRDQEIESLTSEVQQNYNHLLKLAQEISNNRYGQIEQVQQKLVELLKYVGIPEATLHIHLDDLPGNGLNDLGKDQITIYFSANKGVKPAPLNKVASGGELSRLMLGFKYTLADSIFLPTIVFDEIDIGISGEVAKKVGKLIKGLASQHQVISITHLPQVAALGDHHYKVEKSTDQEQTYTYINNLDEEASVYEVATMMAGSKPSETSLQNARELMDSQIEKSR